MASSSLISSSFWPPNWEYDVFLSFHGEDVRRYVLSHIVKEFKNKGINPFIDNEIKRGEFIGPELKKAIHGSRIAIALLSKRYASSSWCLDELLELMKCRKELGQTVITIFYEVEPTDVRKQTGAFGKCFAETCVGKTNVVTKKWIRALAEVATIAGYHSRNWDDDASMIEKITADIWDKLLKFTPSSAFNGLIGMGAHMKRLEPLLRLDLKEAVRMIGIWGPSGIGKTTIARFLYNQLSSRGEYQHSALVENIQKPHCSDYVGVLLELKQQFISKITNQNDFKISQLGAAQDRLKYMKVLVVLDNVTESVQLDAMAENTQCFGSGSRVIITTQDRSLLRKYKIPIYKVDYPTREVAFQIFCKYAFKQNFPADGFGELSREVTRLSGDLPLGLQVIGSYFYGMSKEEWVKNLPRLKTQLDGEIQSKLKFSYDALFDVDKDLFLFIACFFNYQHKEKVEGCLAKNIRNVSQGLQVLADKSLISISDYGYIEMHDLLVQLGVEIVRTGKRQFLVETGGGFYQVLAVDKTIAGSVIGINGNYGWQFKDIGLDLNISGRALEGMTDLQFLRLRGGSLTSMPGCLNNISPKLRVIDWKGSSMTRFPFTDLECLVELDISNSSLENLWEGNKPLPNLRWMDLSDCENLKEIPDLSTATSLRKLDLSCCQSLKELPSSIGNATNLQILNLSYCFYLEELPSSIWNATNLEVLNLKQCESLEKLPSFTKNATNLRKLNLRGCYNLVEVPSSIEYATSLEELNLHDCFGLEKLPSTIGNLHKLSDLNLRGCSKLEALPTNIKLESLTKLELSHWPRFKDFHGISPNFEDLYLGGTAINLKEFLKKFPHAINSIIELDLSCLLRLQDLGPWIKGFSRLRQLLLNGLQTLVSISHLPDSLLFLDADDCKSLQRLDCSFCNPEISLNFGNCLKLNQAARDLIIRTSTRGLVVLPGVKVPDYFTNRASQSSVTAKFNQKPLRTSTYFKACILVDGYCVDNHARVNCSITSKENARTTIVQDLNSSNLLFRLLLLYIFQFEVKEVTSTELAFNFWFDGDNTARKILECGVLQLVELHDDNYKASDMEIDGNESSSKRRRL